MEYSYNHKATKGLNYDTRIEGLLRNQVTNKISTRVIKKCGIQGQIFRMIYHILNLETCGQDADNFEIIRNNMKWDLNRSVNTNRLARNEAN